MIVGYAEIKPILDAETVGEAWRHLKLVGYALGIDPKSWSAWRVDIGGGDSESIFSRFTVDARHFAMLSELAFNLQWEYLPPETQAAAQRGWEEAGSALASFAALDGSGAVADLYANAAMAFFRSFSSGDVEAAKQRIAAKSGSTAIIGPAASAAFSIVEKEELQRAV